MDKQTKIEQGARLGQLIDRLGMSQIAMYKAIGVSQTAISLVINGHRGLSANVIRAIKKKIQFVNVDWLLSGDGEMFLGESPPPAEVKESEPVYNLDPLAPLRSLLDRINEMEERLDRVEKHLNL